MVDRERKKVLVVDDEALFLRTLVDGFGAHADRIEILSAPNGRVAMELLGRYAVDLVVTDLKMPEVDGFELLAYMSRRRPTTPVIVMTAFGTPEIEAQLERFGLSGFLDKPLTFKQIADRVFEVLAAQASGRVQGITLPTFLQMMALERKTCALRVRAGASQGVLYLVRGELVHAEIGELTGETAAMEVISWEHAQIEITGAKPPATTVTRPLAELLLEAFRIKDEDRRSPPAPEAVDAITEDEIQLDADLPDDPVAAGEPYLSHEPPTEGVENMSAQEKLKELAGIEGFAGVAVFTPTGETLAQVAGDFANIKEVGVLCNSVLLNAQKASVEMGTGRGQQVHIECEKAHLIARCLNEGTDPIRSQPGKAHLHVVLALKNDASIGLAKMRVNSVIERVAEDFRG